MVISDSSTFMGKYFCVFHRSGVDSVSIQDQLRVDLGSIWERFGIGPTTVRFSRVGGLGAAAHEL